MIKKAEHWTSEGVKAIINMKAYMNIGGGGEKKSFFFLYLIVKVFAGYIPVHRSFVVSDKLVIHPCFIAVEKNIFFFYSCFKIITIC